MQVEETTKKRLLYRSGAGSQKVGPSDLRRSHWYSTVQYSTVQYKHARARHRLGACWTRKTGSKKILVYIESDILYMQAEETTKRGLLYCNSWNVPKR
jgi:hypothetical protein